MRIKISAVSKNLPALIRCGLIATYLCIVIVIAFTTNSIAATAIHSSSEKSVAKAECVQNKSESELKSYCDGVDGKIIDARNFLVNLHNKEIDNFWRQIDFFKNCFLTLIAFVVAIFSFLGFRSWFELKKMVNTQVSEIFNKEAKDLIDNEVQTFKTHINEIDNSLKELTSFKKKRIVWITGPVEGSDKTENDLEISALRAHGFEDIKILTPSTLEMTNFELGDCDLVVLAYSKTELDQAKLKRVVELIKDKFPPTYLILYTFRADGTQVRIDDIEKVIMNGFIWYLIANFPATIVAHCQMLIKQESVVRGMR